MANSKVKISKKLIIIVVIGIAFTAGYLVARERYKPQINELSTMVIDRDDKITHLNNLRNRLVFKSGELMQNKDGEITAVEETVLLSDGSKVTSEGLITRSNGISEKLNDGDSIFIDGTVISEEELDKMDKSEE